MNPATTDSDPRKSAFRSSAELPNHPSSAPLSPQTPSLPDAAPRSHRPRCAGRESNFLADRALPKLGFNGSRDYPILQRPGIGPSLRQTSSSQSRVREYLGRNGTPATLRHRVLVVSSLAPTVTKISIQFYRMAVANRSDSTGLIGPASAEPPLL
jgi:hypothetical protein